MAPVRDRGRQGHPGNAQLHFGIGIHQSVLFLDWNVAPGTGRDTLGMPSLLGSHRVSLFSLFSWSATASGAGGAPRSSSPFSAPPSEHKTTPGCSPRAGSAPEGAWRHKHSPETPGSVPTPRETIQDHRDQPGNRVGAGHLWAVSHLGSPLGKRGCASTPEPIPQPWSVPEGFSLEFSQRGLSRSPTATPWVLGRPSRGSSPFWGGLPMV